MHDPFREYREMQRAISRADPLREYREMQRAISRADPLREYREMQRAISRADPLREYREMQRALTAHPEFGAQRSVADLRKMLAAISMSDPFKQHRDLTNALASSVALYRSMYGRAINTSGIAVALESIELETDFTLFDPQSETITESISHVLRTVARAIRTSVIDRVSLDFYINLMFTLLVALYSFQLSSESEQRIVSEIATAREELLHAFEEASTNTPDVSMYYVVHRAVRLQQVPKASGTVVTVLYPNQLTRLVERKGKWIRVEYFDHLSGVHRSGWCYKKYLVRVSTSGTEER